jgi:chromosome segregation ATPase
MTISALLSALGLAPKNLPEAAAKLTPAKQTLDSVAALFTAAGLDLDAMLATGPDALKAHLDSLGESAKALADAQARATGLETDLLEAQAKLEGLTKDLTEAKAEITTLKSAAVSTEEKARQLLAQSGHPPINLPVTDEPTRAAKSDAQLAQEYLAMPAGPARVAFFVANEEAIFRAARAR